MIWLVIALQLVAIAVTVWPIDRRRRDQPDAMDAAHGDQPRAPQ